MVEGIGRAISDAIFALLIMVVVIAFGLGVGVTACVSKVGHPTIGWSN